MGIIDELITDRTLADTEKVKILNMRDFSALTVEEKTEYLSGLKGAYNASDLNRVGLAYEFIVNLLAEMGYSVPGYVTSKTDWVNTDIPTIQQCEQYINNVSAIRTRLDLIMELPEDMRFLTYEEANQIERLLVAAQDLLNRIMATYVYCGQPYCGQIWEQFEEN